MIHPPQFSPNKPLYTPRPGPDLTLDEAFADPLIRAVMRADGVDPAALRKTFAGLAERRATGPVERPASRPLLSREWQALVEDCLCAARRAGVRSTSRGWTEVP